ncbi:MAG: hypothetical protein WCK63_17580, partial [Betaproteobacteria bacterium]
MFLPLLSFTGVINHDVVPVVGVPPCEKSAKTYPLRFRCFVLYEEVGVVLRKLLLFFFIHFCLLLRDCSQVREWLHNPLKAKGPTLRVEPFAWNLVASRGIEPRTRGFSIRC